jgi:hypothetical protein
MRRALDHTQRPPRYDRPSSRLECLGEFEKLGERDGRTVVSPCLICGESLGAHMTERERAFYGGHVDPLPEED